MHPGVDVGGITRSVLDSLIEKLKENIKTSSILSTNEKGQIFLKRKKEASK